MAASLLGLAWAPVAWGQPVGAQWLYAKSGAAQRCPEGTQVQNAVSQRLGYSPWRSHGSRWVRVTMDQDAGGFLTARVELKNAQGEVLGMRTLRSSDASCEELAQQVSLAVTLALNPLNLPAPAAPGPPPRAVSRKEYHFWRGPIPRAFHAVHSTWGVGESPLPVGGLSMVIGLRWQDVSTALELRLDTPHWLQVRQATLGSRLAVASLAPCYHAGWLRACGLLNAGVFSFWKQGGGTLSNTTAPYASLGARWGAQVPATSWLVLDTALDANVVLARVRVLEAPSGLPDWTAPPVALVARAGVMVIF